MATKEVQLRHVETEEEHELKLQKAMEDLQAETTVDVDWLYRNKKKKRTATSSAPATATGTTAAAPKPPAPSTSIASTVSHQITPATTDPTTSQKAAAQSLPKLETQATPQQKVSSSSGSAPGSSPSSATPSSKPSASLLSKALRPRSASDPRRPTTQASTPSLSVSTGPQGAPAVSNVSNNTSSLARSNSLSEQQKQKPIKSLFSAFSKLKGRSAPTSPQMSPIQIPTGKGSAQHSFQNHQGSHTTMSSSIESISPVFHSKTMFPGNEVNQRVILNKNPNRSLLPIKEIADLKLRRVTFALDKLSDDPPQQIPSRRPKKGNVIVLEDLLSSEPLKLSVGITNEAKVETNVYDERELKLIKETQRKALEESEKHAQEAHRAASRIAQEVMNFKNKKSSTSGVEKEVDLDAEAINESLSRLEIDKPIHMHEHHFENEIINNEDHHIEISLEAIYTRCCHLREILPIPATLKQLKGKTSPLPILKLLNPRPTLIDVYSFSDFIAITPIKTLVFDNVTMTTEMLKIILSSLLNSTSIEKLSLRNVPIDEQGWKYLCKFISRNMSLHKLDISQQKIKSDLPLTQHRSEMNWPLFIDSLSHRGGIEEFLLNGCKLTVPSFGKLMEDGVSIKTKRLGLAQTDLSVDHIKILMNWATSENSNCEGLDIGFNDLSNDKLKPLIKRISNARNLQSISLNSTHLLNVEDAALLIRSLSKLPNLRFLDSSNLQQIFPGILPYLNKYLPRFPKLTRLHLDFNEFSSKSISIISEIIPKCEHLVHVSITGLTNLSYSAGALLYGAAKSSKSLLNFDLDYDLIDETISSRIALCLMRNMERSMNQSSGTPDATHDDLLFDGSLIAETAGKLIDKFTSKKVNENDDSDEFSQKFLQKQFLEKITRYRDQINKTIDDLLAKRSQNGLLKLQEKEDLLRFYFLDTSLAHISELFQNLDHLKTATSAQQSSIQTNPSGAVKPTLSTVNETPHQMAIEVNGTTVDMATGKPVLLRSVSQTSVQAKKQEEEEGEFHRWGFFVQQQRQILPPTESAATKLDLFIPKLPTGPEIRDAVIKAKGIDSISSLIDEVNHDRFNLGTIYPIVKEEEYQQIQKLQDSGSDTDGDDQEVDEAYDKILNDLSKVRSNK